MASRDFDATAVPQDVVAALSLTAGTRYQGQNASTTATLFIRETVVAPVTGDRAFRVEAGGAFTVGPEPGVAVWLWTDDPAGCPVIVGEAP